MKPILYITASILKWMLAPVLFTYGCIRADQENKLDDYLLNLAEAKDQYGNAVGKYYFNDRWITKDGYKAGNRKETISSFVGKNVVTNTLLPEGKKMNNILNKFQPNHSILSIDQNP